MEEEDTEKTEPHEEEPTDPDFQVPASDSPHKFTQKVYAIWSCQR